MPFGDWASSCLAAERTPSTAFDVLSVVVTVSACCREGPVSSAIVLLLLLSFLVCGDFILSLSMERETDFFSWAPETSPATEIGDDGSVLESLICCFKDSLSKGKAGSQTGCIKEEHTRA